MSAVHICKERTEVQEHKKRAGRPPTMGLSNQVLTLRNLLVRIEVTENPFLKFHFKDLKLIRNLYCNMLITYIVIYLYIGYMHYEEIVFSSLLWFKIFSFSLNIGTAGLSTILTTVLPFFSIEGNEIID